MNSDDINVIKTETFATHRQVVIPQSQESVPEEFAVMFQEWRENRITGEIKISINQGGVRQIVVDETAKVNSESVSELKLEDIFKW